MIIVSLETVKNLSEELHKTTRQYLSSETGEENLFNSLGRLIEAQLYFDPNWWLDLQFCRCDETQIQILSNNSLQIDGFAYWAHRHLNEFFEPAVMEAIQIGRAHV